MWIMVMIFLGDGYVPIGARTLAVFPDAQSCLMAVHRTDPYRSEGGITITTGCIRVAVDA